MHGLVLQPAVTISGDTRRREPDSSTPMNLGYFQTGIGIRDLADRRDVPTGKD